MVKLTDRPDMTLDIHHGRKSTTQHQRSATVIEMICVEFHFFFSIFKPLANTIAHLNNAASDQGLHCLRIQNFFENIDKVKRTPKPPKLGTDSSK